ncbi:hypothetical protein CISG_04826 [Coccidioides immitis RMSCC 3703]|uniref:Uncharacterized protein n=2 Tax=Coccidioides immitis TaxID=5501 RepID=A0A0J8TPL4_COCIT|nr:hypothetical protein CIRG_08838 [Coccidioides immitis RMSCC 2394]KMU75652.1 hypothetical protein CISG_04826 [Coccidioides immitis RMSCC 3703]
MRVVLVRTWAAVFEVHDMPPKSCRTEESMPIPERGPYVLRKLHQHPYKCALCGVSNGLLASHSHFISGRVGVCWEFLIGLPRLPGIMLGFPSLTRCWGCWFGNLLEIPDRVFLPARKGGVKKTVANHSFRPLHRGRETLGINPGRVISALTNVANFWDPAPTRGCNPGGWTH